MPCRTARIIDKPRVIEVPAKEKEGELKGHEDAVLDITFDWGKDGYLVSAGADCSFRIWQ